MRESHRPDTDPDVHKGAVEGDRPDDKQHSNRNATKISRSGMPADPVAVAQDRLGANVDDSEVANAAETGRSADTLRDEEKPLE
jgi:hypothetical protein